jgi:hypothetical protein
LDGRPFALQLEPLLFGRALEQFGEPGDVALEPPKGVDDAFKPRRLLGEFARLFGVAPEFGVV